MRKPWYLHRVADTPKPKRKRSKVYSGPSISKEHRREVGRPAVTLSIPIQSQKRALALVKSGFSPEQEGRSGAYRKALNLAYEEQFGSRAPEDVIREMVGEKALRELLRKWKLEG